MKTGNEFKVGIYLRLSSEDDDFKDESSSITNQRNYILDYLNKSEDFYIVDEYVDDGFTGSNMERPNLQRLLNDIESKKINCIVVKDLSRFGRNDLVPYYINTVFAMKQVRFVAINDYVDTIVEGSAGNKMLAFKSVMNSQYCQDISDKVKSAINIKKKMGQHLGGTAIYGYQKDPNNKYKLIVDENVREYIVMIFDMFSKGNSLKMIADRLDELKVPIPSIYKNMNRGIKSSAYGLWQTRTIDEMLKNEIYIGNMTQCRSKKVSISSKKIVRNPKSKWIVVKNTHEAIIDKDVFEACQNIYKKNSHMTKNNIDNLLKGFLYCKDCNHTIGINKNSNGKKYCSCNYYKKYSKHELCTPHSIPYQDVENYVLNELKILFKKANNNKIESKLKQNDKVNKRVAFLEKDNLRLEKLINDTSNKDENAYMDKLNGLITFEMYTNIHNRILSEKNVSKQKLIDNQKEISDLKSNNINKDFEKVVGDYIDLKTPSRLVIAQIIDKIFIDENKNIEITYKIRKPI